MPIIIVVTRCKDHPLDAPISVTFGLDGGTIGRSADSGLVLPDPTNYVSRLHARVMYQEGKYILEQKGGNATQVNGRTVAAQESWPLNSGDSLLIGPYQLLVEVEPEFPLSDQEGIGSADVSPGDMIDLLLADEVFSPVKTRSASPLIDPPVADIAADLVAPLLEPLVVEPSAPEPERPTVAQGAVKEDESSNPVPLTESLATPVDREPVVSSELAEGTPPQASEEVSPARPPRRVLKQSVGSEHWPLISRKAFRFAASDHEVASRVHSGDSIDEPAMDQASEASGPPLLFEGRAAGPSNTDQGASGAGVDAVESAAGPSINSLSPKENSIKDIGDALTPRSAAFAAGVKAVASALIEHMDPTTLEFRANAPGWMDGLVPARRKAQLWDIYLDAHAELASGLSEDANGWLMEIFLGAYQDGQNKQEP